MKKSFQLTLGIGVLLLFTASVSLAQAYFVSVPGFAFVSRSNTGDYWLESGYVYKPTTSGWLMTEVVFPDDLKYIERMSFTYYDFTTTGQINVRLVKRNRWDGTMQEIAAKNTGISSAANEIKTTSVILGPGRGINNAHYSYYITLYHTEAGNLLRIYQVTFKCQH